MFVVIVPQCNLLYVDSSYHSHHTIATYEVYIIILYDCYQTILLLGTANVIMIATKQPIILLFQ